MSKVEELTQWVLTTNMSTELRDLKGGVSNCCGAEVYTDMEICSDCKEHCELVDEEDAGELTNPAK